MLIAQLTDIHIGFDPGDPEGEANLQRLWQVARRLREGPNRPDLLLLTGDLTEHGAASSYARLKAALGDLDCPIWPIPGNHDDRMTLAAAFSQVPQDGFCHYAIDLNGLRILMLDTLEPGRHGGAFCETRAAWLAEQLATNPNVPTLIAMHHPPFTSGIAWMDTDPAEPWVARFAAAIAGHEQIVAVICGHLHRTIVTRWLGATMIVSPSIAPAVALDLTEIDPGHPDQRALITAEPAGYALHRWDGRNLVSHFESLGDLTVLAEFGEALQPMVQSMIAERP